MNSKEKIMKKLKDEITNIKEALEYLEKNEGNPRVTEVDYKWLVDFGDKDEFKFYDDANLIDWCNEQKETYGK